MFITSLFCAKTLGYAKVSSFELRAASILTILSIGKSTMCVQEIPSVDLLNVLMLKS